MGPGFVVGIWLIIFAVVGTIWAGLVSVAVLGWKKKIAWLMLGAGIPALLMAVGGILIGGFVAWSVFDFTRPESVFKSSFGKPPPASVSDLQSSAFVFADTGSVYLRFRASEAEFRKLVPADMAAKSARQMKETMPIAIDTGPRWWTFRYAEDWLYFTRSKQTEGKSGKRGFMSELEYVAYDPANGLAYYRFSGID